MIFMGTGKNYLNFMIEITDKETVKKPHEEKIMVMFTTQMK